jgi:hypothetical protein
MLNQNDIQIKDALFSSHFSVVITGGRSRGSALIEWGFHFDPRHDHIFIYPISF